MSSGSLRVTIRTLQNRLTLYYALFYLIPMGWYRLVFGIKNYFSITTPGMTLKNVYLK